jgi:serine protease inhibitor
MKQPIIFLVLVSLALSFAQQPACELKEAQETPERSTKLYKGQTIFTLKFLEAANHATPNENLFFSPHSLYQILLIMYFGAHNATEQTLRKGLELHWTDNKNDIASAYKTEKLLRSQRFAAESGNMVKFSSVDKLFFGNQIDVSKCMTDFFTEEIEKLDFFHKPDESRVVINNWVANNTNDEIKDILIPGSITHNTKVAVANAAYFKGTWVSKFKEAETKQELFYSTPENIKFVDMMHVKGSFSHAANEKLACHILELPYKTKEEADSTDYEDSDISMFIMLPSVQTGLEDVLSRMTDDILADVVQDGMHKQVDVKLPKFTIEKTLQLNQVNQR